MSDQIAERVIGIFAKHCGLPREQISLKSSLPDLGIDSLAGLGLIADLEEEFNVTISNEMALRLRTVGQATENLRAVLSPAQTGAGNP